MSKILNISILYLLTIVVSHTSFSQKQELYLTHSKLFKPRIIKEGKMMKVWTTKSNEPIEGQYNMIGDSLIYVGKTEVNIEEILIIKVPTKDDIFRSSFGCLFYSAVIGYGALVMALDGTFLVPIVVRRHNWSLLFHSKFFQRS